MSKPPGKDQSFLVEKEETLGETWRRENRLDSILLKERAVLSVTIT